MAQIPVYKIEEMNSILVIKAGHCRVLPSSISPIMAPVTMLQTLIYLHLQLACGMGSMTAWERLRSNVQLRLQQTNKLQEKHLELDQVRQNYIVEVFWLRRCCLLAIPIPTASSTTMSQAW